LVEHLAVATIGCRILAEPIGNHILDWC
jgi:hypothetical protein